MAVLEGINCSADIKKLNREELKALADELRSRIVKVVQNNGGHLSSNLGVIETTLAVHYVFDLPTDKLIFDVGHQCYAHKLVTGRKDSFDTVRTDGGLSGFLDSDESVYDAFTMGHAGTSLSVGLGYCASRDKLNQDYCVIDIVGDGSFVNGLNIEAISATQRKPKNFIVILNDNGMSISKNHNGFYKIISKGTIKKGYIKGKSAVKKIFGDSFVTRGLIRFRDFLKRIFNKNNYLEQFGFKYVGVVNGNDIDEMIDVLHRAKETAREKAVLLHVKTTKGKGFALAEEQSDVYHGVGKGLTSKVSLFSKTLGEILSELIETDGKIVTVTAGMRDGTGLKTVAETHPDNFIDVGIAEEYAVTLAAGMAVGGLKPVVAVYSTFMQRAYDEILHDVCLQSLPVIFCIDRAGVVGADGKTHQGVFDLSYLTHIPNMKIFAPSTTEELKETLKYALILSCPVAIRYPSMAIQTERTVLPFTEGLWQTVREGDDLAVLAVGPRMISVAEEFADKSGYGVKVINARSVKPLDDKALNEIKDMPIICLEENSVIGGFGAYVLKYYAENGIAVNLVPMGIKDEFIVHGSVDSQLKKNGLTADGVEAVAKEILKVRKK